MTGQDLIEFIQSNALTDAIIEVRYSHEMQNITTSDVDVCKSWSCDKSDKSIILDIDI